MTIRIFIGCAGNAEDAESQAVLEYTLRKHASEPLEIVWMRQTRDKSSFWHGWDTSTWATPFTGFRWGIPAYCGYEGKAIYCDSDMICMADIAELNNQKIPNGKFLLLRDKDGKFRCCTMLIDCKAAKPHIPEINKLKALPNQHGRMTAYLRGHLDLIGLFEGQWNCIDLKRATGINDPSVKMIHYSSMPHQVHLKHAIKRLAAKGQKHWYDGEIGPHWVPELQELFDRLLEEAKSAGYKPENYEPAEAFGDYRKKSFAGRTFKARR